MFYYIKICKTNYMMVDLGAVVAIIVHIMYLCSLLQCKRYLQHTNVSVQFDCLHINLQIKKKIHGINHIKPTVEKPYYILQNMVVNVDFEF